MIALAFLVWYDYGKKKEANNEKKGMEGLFFSGMSIGITIVIYESEKNWVSGGIMALAAKGFNHEGFLGGFDDKNKKFVKEI